MLLRNLAHRNHHPKKEKPNGFSFVVITIYSYKLHP